MDHSLFFVKKEISLERQINTDLALKNLLSQWVQGLMIA
jgi:hypothetical protein